MVFIEPTDRVLPTVATGLLVCVVHYQFGWAALLLAGVIALVALLDIGDADPHSRAFLLRVFSIAVMSAIGGLFAGGWVR